MTTQTRSPLLAVAKDVWWAVLLRGIAAIGFGVIALVWPGITLLALVFTFGVYAIADGILDIVRAVQTRRFNDAWGWWLVGGVASVASGVVAFAWPDITALALVYLIGFWAIAIGVTEVAASFRVHKVGVDAWGPLLATGILGVLLGILLVAYPGSGAVSLVWLIGTFAIVLGATLVAAAVHLRKSVSALG